MEVPYDPIKGIPEKNIPSIICQLNSSNMEINEKLTKDKIVMIDLVGCDKNVSDYARINSITMMNINQKLVIGAITGMFVGNAGNTVTEGSFREALENKFGKKNCDEKEKQNFCREDKQMITVSSYVGDDKREIEKKLGPQWALFSIEILSPEAFHTARKLAANRENDMKSVPPPKF